MHKKTLAKRIWEAKYIYLFMIPGLVFFSVFHYAPMGGLVLAFKNYSARLGMWGSEWVGFKHFERLFLTPMAINAITNTLTINLGRLLFEFPIPIILAILLSEMRGKWCKRIYQTVYTFPHFLSWIIVATLLKDFFSTNGAVNMLITAIGGEKVNFLADGSTFRGILYATSSWKGAGWSAIIYIAAISSIGSEQYEAAYIDGASRLQTIWHITLPGIASIVVIMLILQVGRSMNAGFDQIFNMRNSVVKNTVDIIDTYVHDITFGNAPNYGFSTAVGLFKSVVNTLLLVVSDWLSKRLSGQGLFGSKEA